MFYSDLRPDNNGWGPWKKKFLWLPKKITFTDIQDQTTSTNWMWLKTVHVRNKISFQYSEGILIDITRTIRTYEYAKDLFDLMRRI